MIDPESAQRTLFAVQRNQLAAERTFLSWIRTGIACIGGGVAFERILAFEAPINKLLAYLVGILLIILGMGIFLISYMDYEKEYRRLKSFDPAYDVSMGWRRTITATLWIISLVFLYLIS
jgi:putative membrane protein